jgi:hypothetical protein
MVGCDVVGYTIEPSGKFGGWHVGFSSFVNSQKDVLGEILRLLDVVHPPLHEALNFALMPVDKHLKRHGIIVPDAQH